MECHLLSISVHSSCTLSAFRLRIGQQGAQTHNALCESRTKLTLQFQIAIYHQNLSTTGYYQEAHSCSDWVSQGKSNGMQSLVPQGCWFKSNPVWQNESCYHRMAAWLPTQNKLVVSSKSFNFGVLHQINNHALRTDCNQGLKQLESKYSHTLTRLTVHAEVKTQLLESLISPCLSHNRLNKALEY